LGQKSEENGLGHAGHAREVIKAQRRAHSEHDDLNERDDQPLQVEARVSSEQRRLRERDANHDRDASGENKSAAGFGGHAWWNKCKANSRADSSQTAIVNVL
jgi:hypothetical protein